MIDGKKIIITLMASKIKVVASVPDTTTKYGLLLPLNKVPNIKVVDVCKEDEGISICSALSYCNVRSIMLMQQTGFFDSMNTIIRNAIVFNRPVCMFLGMLGWDDELTNEQNPKYFVNIVEPLIKTLGIDYVNIMSDDDIPLIKDGIENAYKNSKPFIVLLSRAVSRSNAP
jgi:sulfopyruvate decarboxylase subunit beta